MKKLWRHKTKCSDWQRMVIRIQYNIVHVFRVSQQCHWGFFSSGIWLFIMGSWPFLGSVLCN